MASSSSRPATHKPRGICRYYNVPRGCFAGNNCKFLHGEPPADIKAEDYPLLTPYDQSKRCRYYDQGFCKRGDACWFVHSTDSKQATTPLTEDEDEELCSVCFEKPTTYGLLSGCSHIFCITCIKQWREPKNKAMGVIDSGNTKKCPMCRSTSRFITPSSRFWKEGTEEKAAVTQAYKDSMARVPCRYFQKSLQKKKNDNKPLCPYGKDCFYQHLNEDGTPHILQDGADVCIRRYRTRGFGNSDSLFDTLRFMPFTLDLSSLDIDPGGELNVVPGRIIQTDFDTREVLEEEFATRRIHEVGRSLEMLNDAIGDNASLTSLDQAVEVLRAGLGRLGADADTPARRWATRRRPGNNQDDTVMERLEILADQMFASISALRRTEELQQMLRAETPPPPLEPIEGSEGTPAPPLNPIERTRGLPRSRSDDSLPGLQSVSASSSENEMSDDSDDDNEGNSDDEERDAQRTHSLNIAGMPWNELFEGWTSSEMENSTVEAEVEEELPALEAIEQTEERGRGAWTEEDKGDGEFTTDGRGRVISVGTEATGEQSESSRATGRSLLDWFSGLF